MRLRNFKKYFKFHNFSEIFYCVMTKLRNTNLSVFTQCQYTRTILRNKNMGQSLFKKHSKSQNFDEMFYCGMTRLRSTNLNVFIKCQYTRTISRNKRTGQSLFKKSFRKYIYTKVNLRKKTMRQNNFSKCSRCHRFSEIFQYVINRWINTNYCYFR